MSPYIPPIPAPSKQIRSEPFESYAMEGKKPVVACRSDQIPTPTVSRRIGEAKTAPVEFVAHTRYVYTPFASPLIFNRQFVPLPFRLRLAPFHSRMAVPVSAKLTLTFVYRRSIRYVPFASVAG